MPPKSKATTAKKPPPLPKIPRPAYNIIPAGFSPEVEVSVRSTEPPIEHPYPEWMDQELTAEKWNDGPVKAPGKGKGSSKTSSKSDKKSVVPAAPPSLFKDSQDVQLPPSLQEALVKWKRPSDIFKKENLVLYSDAVPAFSDFLSLNKHIVNSELIRHIITGINILQYIGFNDNFVVERQTASYVPNATGPWKGWHHVYALCKAGKGGSHKPLLNNYGKYIVRLYHMGLWRRFVVDDLLPVDECNAPLLPQVLIEGSPIVQLWPMILTKALLKVACLSYKKTSEVTDFNAIYLLTGWSVVEYSTIGLTDKSLWEVVTKYAEQFKYAFEKKPASIKPEKSAKGSAKGSKVVGPPLTPTPLEDLSPKYVCAMLSDLTKEGKDALPQISPCFSHPVLIRETRDKPLEYIPPETDPEPWKYYRWIPWAIKNGLYHPNETFNIKSLQVVSFMKKCYKTVPSVPQPDLEITIPEPQVVAKGKPAKIDAPKGTGAAKSMPPLPNPGVWFELEQISKYISKLYIFQKPSTFVNNFLISPSLPKYASMKAPAPAKKGAPPPLAQFFNLVWPNTISLSRNMPLYLFCENLKDTHICINFSHLNISAVKKNPAVDDAIVKETDKAAGDAVARETDECAADEEMEYSLGYCMLEKFNWKQIQVENPIFVVKTISSKSDIISVPKGRTVYKLWFNSSTTYNIHIMARNKILLGSLEKIFELMSYESFALKHLAFKLSDAYYDLLFSFGTKDYNSMMRKFYTAVQVDNKGELSVLEKHITDYVYDLFFDEFLERVRDVSANDAIFQIYKRALRILFLNPSIGRRIPPTDGEFEEDKCDPDACQVMEECNSIENCLTRRSKAADVIKSFFRGIYLRKLKTFHKQSNIQFRDIWNLLKTIYDNVLADPKREMMTATLFRRLFADDVFRKCYTCSNDLNFTIQSLSYKGSIAKIESQKWTPILRLVLYCHSEAPALYRLEMFCPLPLYMLRVFDNDDNQELSMFTNSTAVCEYKQNNNGYTVIGYGWNTTPRDIPVLTWKLGIYSDIGKPMMHFCNNKPPKCVMLKIPKLIKQATTNYYVPDQSDRICKCLVKVKHNAQLTIAWQSSYNDAMICVQCVSENGTTMGQMIGKGNLEIPVLLFEYRRDSDESMQKLRAALARMEAGMNEDGNDDDSYVPLVEDTRERHLRKPDLNPKKVLKDTGEDTPVPETAEYVIKETVYVVEALVVEEKWPLLPSEWAVSDDVKYSRYLKNINMKLEASSVTSLTPKGKGKKPESAPVEKKEPYWTLSLGVDADDALTFTEDRSREEEILKMKRSWEDEYPGRYLRAEQVRKHYLECKRRNYQYCLPEEVFFGDGEGEDEPEGTSFSDVIMGDRRLSKANKAHFPKITINKDGEKRTLVHPKLQLILDFLPGLDVSQYPCEEHKYVITQQNAETLTFTRILALKDFWKTNDDFLEEMAEFYQARAKRNQLIIDTYAKLLEDSTISNTEAFEKRNGYIVKVLEDEKRRAAEAAAELKAAKKAEQANKGKK